MEQGDHDDLRRVLREWQVPGAPAELEARVMAARPAWRPRLLLAAASVALVAAGALLSGVSVHPVKSQQPAGPLLTVDSAGEAPFVPVPYVAPLDSYETGMVLRLNLPVAALTRAGYRIPGVDPTATVLADVLVGDDGRAHAVRLVSTWSLEGGGD